MTNQVIIVIPIYKPLLTSYEQIAFNQALTILGKYPISIIAPQSMKFDFSLENKIEIKRFDNKYFNTKDGYNKLILSSFFYQRFKSYKYILIYQLDAFVFRDELDYWCNQNYDYIGAPWYENWDQSKNTVPLWITGNGGFSLRNVHSFITLFKDLQRIDDLKSFHKLSWINKIWFSPVFLFHWLFPKMKIDLVEKYNNQNEDWVYSYTVNSEIEQFKRIEKTKWKFLVNKIKGLKIPVPEVALRFSIEHKPSNSYKLLSNNLPFGCHAWEKHEIDFWRKIFQQYNYEI